MSGQSSSIVAQFRLPVANTQVKHAAIFVCMYLDTACSRILCIGTPSSRCGRGHICSGNQLVKYNRISRTAKSACCLSQSFCSIALVSTSQSFSQWLCFCMAVSHTVPCTRDRCWQKGGHGSHCRWCGIRFTLVDRNVPPYFEADRALDLPFQLFKVSFFTTNCKYSEKNIVFALPMQFLRNNFYHVRLVASHFGAHGLRKQIDTSHSMPKPFHPSTLSVQ